MNLHRLIISLAILGSAYAVSTVDPSTPPVVMQPVATPTVAPPGEGDAAVVSTQPDDRLWPDIPLTEGEFAELQERLRKEIEARKTPESPGEVLRSTEPAPLAQVGVRISSPRGSGFCTTGNCGPAQARRVYQVQRPQRAGLFRGLLRGRR